MRLILLLIFSFCSWAVNGQIINASPPYRVRATASCSYLLDTYSGAAAAYSLRKLDGEYAGSAIRVRRSSDNSEQDIGFTGSCGDLDTASLKTFVGTGGTDDGFVVTWYDQSGNSRDVTQSTAGTQPQIMDNGVVIRRETKPAVYFNQYGLAMTSVSLSSSASSVFGVFTTASLSDNFTRVFSFCKSSQQDYEVYAPFLDNGGDETQWGCYTNGGVRAAATGFTADDATLNLFTGTNTGSGVANSRDNGTDATYSHSIGSFTIDRITVGCSALTSAAFNDGNLVGCVLEIIFYNSDNSANKSGINTNINSYYSIY